jgi:hypothetical protein
MYLYLLIGVSMFYKVLSVVSTTAVDRMEDNIVAGSGLLEIKLPRGNRLLVTSRSTASSILREIPSKISLIIDVSENITKKRDKYSGHILPENPRKEKIKNEHNALLSTFKNKLVQFELDETSDWSLFKAVLESVKPLVASEIENSESDILIHCIEGRHRSFTLALFLLMDLNIYGLTREGNCLMDLEAICRLKRRSCSLMPEVKQAHINLVENESFKRSFAERDRPSSIIVIDTDDEIGTVNSAGLSPFMEQFGLDSDSPNGLVQNDYFSTPTKEPESRSKRVCYTRENFGN